MIVKIFRILRRILSVLMVFAILWGAGFGWFAFYASTFKPYDLNQNTDVIAVLTGGEGRLDTGLNLFSARRGQYLFITGVYDRLNENDIRQRWQGKSDLPICCIVLDHEAETTAQNAVMTRKWIQSLNDAGEDSRALKTVRLVTSNYHMPRALIDFNRLLPDINIYPHPIVSPNASSGDKLYWVLLVDEFHKYIFRFIQATLSDKWQEVMA